MPPHDDPPETNPSVLQLSLVEEINHRVINEFAEAISSLDLAERRANPEARSAIAFAAKRLLAHSNLHRALLPPIAHGPIELGRYVGNLCSSFAEASLADRGMQLVLHTDDVWIEANRAWRVGLIVAELVRNAAQHGYFAEDKLIRVGVEQSRDQIICWVSNGADDAGLEPGPGRGRGRGLICSLAAELGGSTQWEFDSRGCRASLAFPALVAMASDVTRAGWSST